VAMLIDDILDNRCDGDREKPLGGGGHVSRYTELRGAGAGAIGGADIGEKRRPERKGI
jgi:hypothetical protein